MDAGVAASTRWFRGPAGEGTPGAGPTVGAGADLWLVPTAGVRLHLSYAAQPLESTAGTVRLHSVFYDVSAVVRPFSRAQPRLLRGAYLFAGAGAVTTTTSGGAMPADSVRCRPEFFGSPGLGFASDVCVRRGATMRAQATVGGGSGRVALSERVGLFAGVELHLYRPPVDPRSTDATPDASAIVGSRGAAPEGAAVSLTGGAWAPSGLAATGRLTLGLRAATGRPPSPSIPPPPPPSPDRPVTPPASAPTTGGYVEVRTIAPGAEVYLIPFGQWRRASMLCRLRPLHGARSFYQGSTASQVSVNALIRRPITHYLVVVQGRRYYEERIQVANNGVERRQLNMAVDGVPTGCR
ncbi:MAG TPA: hypothetical protein VEX86_16790 [Longimicrobium sp.]|nr:hypothetical protein [Longimicrobium sp.]